MSNLAFVISLFKKQQYAKKVIYSNLVTQQYIEHLFAGKYFNFLLLIFIHALLSLFSWSHFHHKNAEKLSRIQDRRQGLLSILAQL